MKKYYLGLNADGPKISRCLWSRGTKKDLRELSEVLAGKYKGAPMLTKNGRSALCLALKAYFDGGDKIIVTGFTCFAVYEAIVKAGMTPIFADINREDLNFDAKTLETLMEGTTARGAKGIIVQNTLGCTVEMREIEKFAKKHHLIIIEDLAHSAGNKYLDGREVGTVGAATMLSFGRDKAINAITGGAVIFRAPKKHEVEAPFKSPHLSDYLRARFYPLFCGIFKQLNKVHLGGVWMRFLLLTHQIERTADSKLDMSRRPPKFVAKIATEEIRGFRHRGPGRIRDFYLVKNRAKCLEELRRAGYYFDGLWYEKPVSPERYYQDVKFPEKKCPVAVKVAEEIVNFPRYYKRAELETALEIIKPYLKEETK